MQEWGLAHIVEDDAEHFVSPQGIKGLRDCISWRTFCPYNHNTDFSVVLFRPTFMLISEKNRMKVHKNQWLLTMPYPLERLAGATSRGQTMAPEGQKPSKWLCLTKLPREMYS
jgi:hypothetical protein